MVEILVGSCLKMVCPIIKVFYSPSSITTLRDIKQVSLDCYALSVCKGSVDMSTWACCFVICTLLISLHDNEGKLYLVKVRG